MFLRIIVFAFVALGLMPVAMADEASVYADMCKSFSSHATDTFSTRTGYQQFMTSRLAICTAWQEARSDADRNSTGASLDALISGVFASGAYSQSHAGLSQEEKRGWFCSDRFQSEMSASDYNQASEVISAKYAEVAKSCVENFQSWGPAQSVFITAEATSKLRSSFRINVQYKTNATEASARQVTSISPSNSITCFSSGAKVTFPFTPQANTFSFDCDKDPADEVSVEIDTKLGKSNSVVLEAKSDEFSELQDQVRLMQSADVGVVGFFALTNCPQGWTEYAPARGRYVVGIYRDLMPPEATVGTVLQPNENRPTGAHTHLFPYFSIGGDRETGLGSVAWKGDGAAPRHIDLGYTWGTMLVPSDADKFEPGSKPSAPQLAGHRNEWSPTVPAGTNAPYVALLACKKN